MCIKGLILEKREQDGQLQLVARTQPLPSPGPPTVEYCRERRDSETIIIPISPSQLHGRRRVIPNDPPVVVEVSPSGNPRHASWEVDVEVDIGCGAIFVVVEESIVKQRICNHRHRCQRCRDRGSRKSRDGRNEEGEHGKHREKQHRKHEAKTKTTLADIVNKISDLLKVYGDRDEEWRRLRGELQKIKDEEKHDGRKLDHIEKLLEDVAASPLLSSPSPEGHRHLRHHDAGCGCHHCHPPRAPPSTPSMWQGPYGCQPPPHSIPHGKRTHKHHKHCERKEHKRHPWQNSDSSLTNSTITAGSGSSRSSRASQIARDSFEKMRNYATRQSRKLKAMDAKIDGVKAQLEKVDAKVEGVAVETQHTHSKVHEVAVKTQHLDAKVHEAGTHAAKTDKRVEKVEVELHDAVHHARSTDAKVEGVHVGLKATNEKVHGLGLRLDDTHARTEVLGVQMKQVDARASMAQNSAQQLDSKVGALTVQGEVQAGALATINQRVEAVEDSVEVIQERQRREERQLDDLRKERVGKEVVRSYVPVPWPWPQQAPPARGREVEEVEYEEDIEVDRIERVRRARGKSRDGRRSGRRLSYTRNRGNGRFDDKFTLERY